MNPLLDVSNFGSLRAFELSELVAVETISKDF
jgi:hypothetical protein